MNGTKKKRGRFILDKEEKRKKRKLKHETAQEAKQSLSKEEYLNSDTRQHAVKREANKKKWKNTDKNDIQFFTPHVMFDLRYHSHMKPKENKSTVNQLQHMYAALRASDRPVKVYISGISPYIDHLNALGYQSWKVFGSEKSFDQEPQLFPKENLIYLSPDSPNVLTQIDHSKIYIIGGIVDHNRLKGLSLKTAESLGIQTAKLPLLEYLPDMADISLNVNHVMEILMAVGAGQQWKEAITNHVPKRKGFWKENKNNTKDDDSVDDEADSSDTATTTTTTTTTITTTITTTTTTATTTITTNTTKLCRVCKQHFNPSLNTIGSSNDYLCRFHKYSFSGRLNRVEPTDCSGLEFIWNCCGSTDVNAPGCTVGRHVSYDDPDIDLTDRVWY